MKNKKSLIIILLILVIGFIIFISTGNNDLNDEAFYVEGNGNLFIYIAKIIDNNIIDKKVDYILQEAKESSNNNGDILFDKYLEEINDVNNRVSSMAYMYSYIKTSSLNETEKVYILSNNEYEEINTDTFDYDDLYKYDVENSTVVYERGE